MAQQAERFAPVVTDRGGHLVLLLREDGAGPYLIDLVRRRGYTATSANSRTSAISKVEDERSGAPEPHLVLSRGLLMAGGPRADLGYALSALDDDFERGHAADRTAFQYLLRTAA
jgi:uncharacterized protein GlcG (DUF336 family)